jgi:hypothetical protein
VERVIFKSEIFCPCRACYIEVEVVKTSTSLQAATTNNTANLQLVVNNKEKNTKRLVFLCQEKS